MAVPPDDSRLAQLERRVQVDPTSVAFAALAEEYRRIGRYQDAVDVSRKGLIRHPAYLSARVTLGRALLNMNALDEAREEFELVLRSAPENLAAIRGLAEIHHRGGQTRDSAEHYQAALAAAEQGLSNGAFDQVAAEPTREAAGPEPTGVAAAASAATPQAVPPDEPRDGPAVPAVARVGPVEAAPAALPGESRPVGVAPVAPPGTAAPVEADPALAALEAFLAQIVAARMTRGPADADR